MKKLFILLTLSASLLACNSGTKDEAANDDTTETGENSSAAAQQSSVDTNVNKIGTDPAIADTSKSDSVPKD